MTFNGVSDDQLSTAMRGLLDLVQVAESHDLRAALMPALRLLGAEVRQRGGLNLPQAKIYA